MIQARRLILALSFAWVLSSCAGTAAAPPVTDPYVAELQFLALKIENAGGTAVMISGQQAQLAVRKVYGPSTKPSFVKNVPALEAHWTTNVSLAFNGSDPAGTLESDELVRFSNSASSALGGRFWTLLNQVIRKPGVAYGPIAVKNLLALPDLPTFAGLGGSFADGSEVYIGKAAANEWGSGGGMQLFAVNGGGGVTSLTFADYRALVASQPFSQ